jgi:hypothetical protein
MKKKKKPFKGPNLTVLKKKAPKVPDFTCLQIDNVIDKIREVGGHGKGTYKKTTYTIT